MFVVGFATGYSRMQYNSTASAGISFLCRDSARWIKPSSLTPLATLGCIQRCSKAEQDQLIGSTDVRDRWCENVAVLKGSSRNKGLSLSIQGLSLHNATWHIKVWHVNRSFNLLQLLDALVKPYYL